MLRFGDIDINILSDAEKQQYLLSCIPFLSAFKRKNGSEGEVFFISDKIIVKKYFSQTDTPAVLNGLFDKYCEESNYFRAKGYNIPKIYTWTVLSRPDHSGFDYYLLEERVPGRELFVSSIMKMSDRFAGALDNQEFRYLIDNPEYNTALYNEILSSYIHDFLTMNEKIESMPEKNLEKFLTSVYDMFSECRYAIPDVHARNVLYHNESLNLIDLYLEKFSEGYKYSEFTPPELLLLSRMVALFNYNGDIKKYKSNDYDLRKINHDIELNELLCTEAMKKVIRTAKKSYEFNPSQEWWKVMAKRMEKVLEKENMESVVKEINPKLL